MDKRKKIGVTFLTSIRRLWRTRWVYRQNKSPDALAFYQRGLCVSRLAGSAHIANRGSGEIMSTARLELPCPRVSQAKFRDETSRRGK